MKKDASSDGLPFLQVHRSTLAKAALLASAMGVSTQHALGSLLQFWALVTEPRDLARIIAAAGEDEPAVTLTTEELAVRWRIASGQDAQPAVLESCGFIEPLTDGRYRVRGLSRYFDSARRYRAAAASGRRGASARWGSDGVATTNTADPNGDPIGSGCKKEEGRRKKEEGRSEKKISRERAPSVWEACFKEMQEHRLERMRELWPNESDAPAGGTSPQVLSSSRLNQVLKGAAETVQRLDPVDGASLESRVDDLLAMWRRYLWSGYWKNREPPFPVEGFAAAKTLERIASMWGTPRDPVTTEEEWS